MNSTPNQFGTKSLLVVAAVLALGGYSAQATVRSWTNTAAPASYTTAAFWSPSGVPVAADNAIANNGSNTVVLINAADPAWTVTDVLPANAAGSGSFLQNGSTVTVNGWFRMGNASGAVGFYTMSNGVLNVVPASSQMNIGEVAGAIGTFNIAGGRLNKGGASGTFWVGKAGVGNVNLSGTGSIVCTNNIQIADRSLGGAGTNAVGTFNQSGGTNTVLGEIWIGNGAGGTNGLAGTYNLSGGILNANSWVAIGRNSAQGLFNMTGGIFNKNAGGNFTIAGIGTTQTGTFTQSGGAFTNTATETWVGETGIGIFTITNTATARLGLLRFATANAAANGTVNLDGGTLTVNSMNKGTGTATFNFNGGTLKAGGASAVFMTGLNTANVKAGGAFINDDGFAITIGQALLNSGGGGLTKSGGGTVTLTGVNTYTGATAVNAGTLAIRTSATGAGSYSVADTAKLSATVHVLNGQINMSTLSLATSTAATLDVDLAAFGTPTLAPINVVGALTLNGAITLNVPNGLVAVGEIPLVKYGSLAGAGSVTLGSIPLGVQGYLTNNTGANPNTYSLVATSVGLPRWQGSTNGVPVADWTIGTISNWVERTTGNPAVFSDAQPVLFSDEATGTNVATLTTTVTPSSLLVNNTNKNYTINGGGKITGSTGLTKQGTGALTITAANDFTGPVLISRGTVTVGNLANGGSASAIGASSANATNLVIDAATLSYTGPDVVINRSFTAQAATSTLSTASNLTVVSQTTAASSGLIKTGAGQLTYVGGGTTQVGNGAFPAYQVASGTVMFDGSVGGQVITNNGEMWVGGTTTSGASLIVSNTALVINNWFAVGRGNGSIGNVCNVNLYNSSMSVANMSLGYDGGLGGNLNSQVMNVNNSTVNNTGNFFIGESSGSTTTVSFNNSASASVTLNVALGGTAVATLNLNNATNTCTTLNVGMGGSSVGTLNLNNSSNACTSLYVGLGGTTVGTVNVTNSTILCANFVVATNSTSTGTVNQASGYVGRSTGGGDWRIGGNGAGALAVGTYNLSGGTFEPNGNFQIGAGGLGTWNQTGGTMNENSGFPVVGRYATGSGVANISGGTFNQNGVGQLLIIGEQGTGTLNVSGSGVVNLLGGLSISHTATGVGTVNLNGGTLATRLFQSLGNGAGGTGVLNLNGGLIVATNAALNFMSNLTSANVLAGGATIDTAGNTISIAQALLNGGGGGITKIGNGTLYLNGVNTYTGNTTVSNGVLGGTGTIAGTVIVVSGATLAPGASIGTLTLGAAPTFGGTTLMEISGPSSADKLNVTSGTVVFGGTLTVTNIGGALAPGNTFDLFDGTLSGSFSTLNLPNGASHWNTSDLNIGGTIAYVNANPVAANLSVGVAVGGTTTASVIGKYAATPDADGDAVTITVVSTPGSGTATIVGGTNIIYTSTGGPGSDSFTYTVSDGLGGTDTKTVSVTISSPEGFNKLAGPVNNGNGTFTLDYLGIPGLNYALDESPDLVAPYTWYPVLTNTASGSGAISYTVPLSYPSGSFRTRYVP